MERPTISFTSLVAAGAFALVLPLAATPAYAGPRFAVTPLVASPGIDAPVHDPLLVNSWGLAATATSPWWSANNGTATATLYNGAGVKQGLEVHVPGAPTGAVANGGAGFIVKSGNFSGAARFLFASEDGTISGWSPAVPPPQPSTQAFVAVDNSGSGAIYKGLAIDAGFTRLYATDFHNGRIDVWASDWTPVQKPGAFVDRDLPRGYGPFGIAVLGGTVYVTYAKQDADAEDDVAGHGLGVVDAYDLDGKLLHRVASHGGLNSPWGLAIAPQSWGRLAGALLVGNFGDGRINVYEAGHGHGPFHPRGALREARGKRVAIDGLWAIAFGNGAGSGPTDTLYFTSGPDDEKAGLFGKIEIVVHVDDDDDDDEG